MIAYYKMGLEWCIREHGGVLRNSLSNQKHSMKKVVWECFVFCTGLCAVRLVLCMMVREVFSGLGEFCERAFKMKRASGGVGRGAFYGLDI